MDDPAMDLRDRRGRLIRLIIGVALGGLVTTGIMWAIAADSAMPHRNTIGTGSVGILGVGVFIITSALASVLVSRAHAWRTRRALPPR